MLAIYLYAAVRAAASQEKNLPSAVREHPGLTFVTWAVRVPQLFTRSSGTLPTSVQPVGVYEQMEGPWAYAGIPGPGAPFRTGDESPHAVMRSNSAVSAFPGPYVGEARRTARGRREDGRGTGGWAGGPPRRGRSPPGSRRERRRPSPASLRRTTLRLVWVQHR